MKFLYLRKLQRSAAESLEDLARRVFGNVDHKYMTSDGVIQFPNGSRIIIGGYKNPDDIERYIGIEYDAAIIEELTQVTESKIVAFRGSVRSSKPNWRSRIYCSTNPGGVGHSFIKREFVVPHMKGEKGHRLVGGLVKFFPATYKENPFLPQDYVEYLEALTGPLGEAWRDGSWDSFEGMAFPDWNSARHVVKPYLIPDSWPKWRSIDWGYNKPFVCLWMAKDLDTGRIVVYRELVQTNLTDRQQARSILELTPGNEKIGITYADPSMWARKNLDNRVSSTADEYAEEGVVITAADNARIDGVRRVHRVLADLPDGKPGIEVFSTCRYLIETMENLPTDELNPEDVDTDAEDHGYDSLRYGLTNYRIIREPKTQTKKQVTDRQTMAMKRWFNQSRR